MFKSISFSNFAYVWSILSSKERLLILFTIFMAIMSAASETLSVLAIVPFVNSLVSSKGDNIGADLSSSSGNISISTLFSNLSLLQLALIFIFLSIAAMCIRVASVWLNLKVPALIGNKLSYLAYVNTLQMSYIHHTRFSSSYYINIITTQINQTVVWLNAILQFCCGLLLSGFVISMLFMMEPYIMSLCFIILSAAYLSIMVTTKPFVSRLGTNIVGLSELQLSVLKEHLGIITDIILSSSSLRFANIYRRIDKKFRILNAYIGLIGIAPKVLIESLGVLTLLLIFTALKYFSDSNIVTISTLSLIGYGLQKLLPAIQSVYASIHQINGLNPAVSEVRRLINNSQQPSFNLENSVHTLPSHTKSFISFHDAILSYPGPNSQSTSQYSLGPITLEIEEYDVIGILGPSGSGKTTFVLSLMGLLEPRRGSIYVDGNNIYQYGQNQLSAWRSDIGYVPQNVYIRNTSLRRNIVQNSLFNEDELTDYENILAVCQLNNSYMNSKGSTPLGDNGSTLSGGQKQRIGIARALYRKPRLLVLDEYTSSLDSSTEKQLADYIFSLAGKLTILIISHREEAIVGCTRRFYLRNGMLSEI